MKRNTKHDIKRKGSTALKTVLYFLESGFVGTVGSITIFIVEACFGSTKMLVVLTGLGIV